MVRVVAERGCLYGCLGAVVFCRKEETGIHTESYHRKLVTCSLRLLKRTPGSPSSRTHFMVLQKVRIMLLSSATPLRNGFATCYLFAAVQGVSMAVQLMLLHKSNITRIDANCSSRTSLLKIIHTRFQDYLADELLLVPIPPL